MRALSTSKSLYTGHWIVEMILLTMSRAGRAYAAALTVETHGTPRTANLR